MRGENLKLNILQIYNNLQLQNVKFIVIWALSMVINIM